MDYSRPSKCTEPSCGTILHNGASHEAYPQPQNRPATPVKCPMENCKWIGEITSYEPIPLSDATHIVVPKEDHEKFQDKLGKLTHDLYQSRKLESEKEKEWREAKEARERHESDLMKCISSQNSMSMNPVIRRDVVANQQIEANSTASLGRAQQLPQQERSRTLDAEGSDFQQFLRVCEQEGDDHHGENYEQPQLEQQNQTREALVVAPINIPAESESPPPLPPKPKRSTQNDSSSADLIPPKLPPKPNSNRGPPTLYPRSQEGSRNAQQNDTIPPPRPPKPSQARAAVPQPQRRRKKSPPTPPQDYEEGRGMSPLDENSVDSANCGVRLECPADCRCVCHCVDRRDSTEQLRKNYGRFNSNTKRKAKRCHSE